jgi:hypothetical protein
MNFNEAEAEIRKHFAETWGTLTAISWPDIKFTVPRDETWVRFNSQETVGSQVSMGSPGSNRFRHFGIVTIQIFQPQDQGSKDARAKATTALGAFMGVTTTNGIKFFDVTARQIGNDGGGFYRIHVIASFYYDEIT